MSELSRQCANKTLMIKVSRGPDLDNGPEFALYKPEGRDKWVPEHFCHSSNPAVLKLLLETPLGGRGQMTLTGVA